MVLAIAFATFIATLIGGFFALKFRDKLHLVLGFSAGAVIGVAFFDLLPEALSLGQTYFDTSVIASFAALGFIAYLVIDRLITLGTPHESDEHAGHAHHHRGTLGAASLVTHSFLDGVAIGLAFQVSSAVGWVVALAVLAHDFSDGINTVNMILKNNGSRTRALRWLFIGALAPVLGAASTMFFSLPQEALAVTLALFAGFFLCIGASDLVPEIHHGHPKLLTTVMTVLGMMVLYAVVRVAAF